MHHTTDPGALLLPSGTRLLHVGPHKTGTTSLQGALWRARPAMLEQGVRHAGRGRNPANAVRSVTGQASPYSDDTPPPVRQWRGLVREITGAHEPRVVVSSEFFAWAAPDVIRRIVDDLDPSRVRIAVTLRPLARIMPSMWQQNVQAGAVVPFDKWLDNLLRKPRGKGNAGFWTLERHDELIDRWASVVGIDRVTAVVVDDRDHLVLMRVFEQLLGLREGTLVPDRDLMNRSLTLPEVEAVRAFNVRYRKEAIGRALHARIMRFGAAQQMKLREPDPAEPRVEMPQWALDLVDPIAHEMVDRIAASGVRVVGDLALLTQAPPARAEGAPGTTDAISPEIAAAMAMGVLVSTGAARRAKQEAGFQVAEPVELVRVPTYQVLGVVALRARDAVVRRLGWLRHRVAGVVGRG